MTDPDKILTRSDLHVCRDVCQDKLSDLDFCHDVGIQPVSGDPAIVAK